MNRIEFMTELAALLQDIPVVERQEAMKYYNDYFDDAGEENEHQVIEELESPAKVAATIKADLGVQGTGQQGGAYSEYRETGYNPGKEAPKTNSALKIILIIAIIFVCAPVIIPVSIALLAVVFAGVITVFCLFLSIVIASAAIAIAGVVLFFAGVVTLIPEIAVGLALIGTGLILSALGAVGIIAGIKLCVVVLPGIVRGIVWICRRPFHGKAVA